MFQNFDTKDGFVGRVVYAPDYDPAKLAFEPGAVIAYNPVNEHVIWAAGFFDGEGSITITRRKRRHVLAEGDPTHNHVLVIHVSQTAKKPLQRFVDLFGGTLTYDERKSAPGTNQRPIWRWMVSARAAGLALEQLLPYLYHKHPQAEIALRFQSARYPVGGVRRVPDFVCDGALRDEIRALNKTGRD